MTIKDLRNKEVTVMGLGRLGGGVGVVKFLARNHARVLVTDIKKQQDLADSLELLKDIPGVEFVLGHHRKEDFIDKDFIIKNPGVPQHSPYLRLAREHNVPIETDISLFFKLSPASIIGITGTKGKSTTASLLYEMLKEEYTTFLAGNIGITPLTILSKADANSLVVLELSSWQLEDLASFRVSPEVSLITNIYEDHLNRHGTMAHYVEAKKNIFLFGKKNYKVILNDDDPVTREFGGYAPGKAYYFSAHHRTNGAFFSEGKLYFGEEETSIAAVEQIQLQGEHNLANIAAAVSVAKLYKVSNKVIANVVKQFSGVPFRQEIIRDIEGVTFVNDTTATNPAAVIASLRRFGSGIILIAGGVDKELDYEPLAKEIKNKVKFLVLLPGSASEKLKHLLEKTSYDRFREVETLKEAVKVAFTFAKKADWIVFSPGAASFNLFKNEFDRGTQFNELVNSLSQ